MDIQITGDKDVLRSIQRIKKNAPAALDGALLVFATDIQGSSVQSIQASGSSGAAYTRRTVQHTASAPGNPPNTDTGQLVRNITVKTMNIYFR
jgi:hypothetical protein